MHEHYYSVMPKSTPFGVFLFGHADTELLMPTNSEIQDTRRQRLRQLIADRYGWRQAALIEDIGINQGELSGLLREKSFGEKKARALEAMLDLPEMWLDRTDSPESCYNPRAHKIARTILGERKMLQPCRHRLNEDELRVVEDYRSMTAECRTCVKLLIAAAVEMSFNCHDATIIDLADYLTKPPLR